MSTPVAGALAVTPAYVTAADAIVSWDDAGATWRSLGVLSGSVTIALTGDVTGSGTTTIATTVVRLQGRPLAATAPGTNEVIQWSGTQWQPATLALTSGTVTSIAGGVGITVSPSPIVGAGTVSLTVPVSVANGGTGATTAGVALTNLGGAPLASPVFTGDPRAPTPATADNDTSVATTAFVQAAVAPALNDVGRNLIHNPLFNVWQRGFAAVAGGYGADRWKIGTSGDTVSAAFVAVGDTGRGQIGEEAAIGCIGTTFTGSAAATAFTVLQQPIENARRLAGKTVTVSFWAVATVAGLKLGISFDQVFGTGGSPSAPVLLNGTAVTLTTSWVRYTASFAMPSVIGKTTGSNVDDYTALNIWYSAGANSNARAGGIGVQSGVANIWGVQVEVGSVATPLEKPDPQQDLAKCQRFYQVTTAHAVASMPAFNYVWATCSIAPMRATPTFTSAPQVADTNVVNFTVDTAVNNSFRVWCQAAAAGTVAFDRYIYCAADL